MDDFRHPPSQSYFYPSHWGNTWLSFWGTDRQVCQTLFAHFSPLTNPLLLKKQSRAPSIRATFLILQYESTPSPEVLGPFCWVPITGSSQTPKYTLLLVHLQVLVVGAQLGLMRNGFFIFKWSSRGYPTYKQAQSERSNVDQIVSVCIQSYTQEECHIVLWCISKVLKERGL